MDTAAPGWVCTWIGSLVNEDVRSLTRVESREVNAVFRVELDRQRLFLKIGPGLQREYERLRWLDGLLPCPRPVGFTTHDETGVLLMSAIDGASLAELSGSLPPQVIISRLSTALLKLHATNILEWPFVRTVEGTVLVHGDACLPNFLFHEDRLSGYIDVGDMTVGEPEVDLAAAVWSLQYNLGPGYGLAFLHAYGLKDADEARVEALRRKYELS